mmetsp:Transcript_36065/g.94823  ORF Transcript_36065/g.94823 Transcript_36065/m.94823 type:complete len:203 (-) Transcript_36065:481-1089(-)|eukprot:CAMPEP_0113704872 /NCGR_PEP_ID=MMETSP0038_2-20120614/26785_1 /TAXON_ID=2898 /ORGANISM="Cryptomonas paramecium" /LENGTH=202 /DNA_ID=CAMNT_0000629751 /DNA_START=67 /DNA_END=675 /DNA_ORIENTATION=+ /assembly_acc=CAM_ASM_000170
MIGFGQQVEECGEWTLEDIEKMETVEKDDMASVFANALQKEVNRNSLTPCLKTSNFHSTREPEISASAYVARIFSMTNCSPSCFVFAWRYLKQIESEDWKFMVNKLNVHRLVLTAIMIASKFIEDKYYSNQYWSRVGGITNDELNALEREMLFTLSFKLSLTRPEFLSLESHLKVLSESSDDCKNASGYQIMDSMQIIEVSG